MLDYIKNFITRKPKIKKFNVDLIYKLNYMIENDVQKVLCSPIGKITLLSVYSNNCDLLFIKNTVPFMSAISTYRYFNNHVDISAFLERTIKYLELTENITIHVKSDLEEVFDTFMMLSGERE